MAFKIVYLGAGSFRFSPFLFMDICRATELSPLEVWLVDIDAIALKKMTQFFSHMVKKAKKRNGIDIKVYSTTDRVPAFENANFIFKSISVGMQDAEWYDIYIPLKFGIPQNTGDTVGPGGLFRNLRTDPVAAAMAQDAKKLCPKAPILSYTNPQSSSVLAVKTVAPDVQWMGLCHELFGGMGTIKRALKKYGNIHVKKWEEFDIEYTGVNHFTWLTSLKLKDEDLYPIIRKNAHDMVLKNFAHHGFNFHLCEKYGYFSIPGGRHVAEFLPDYYNYFNHEIQCPYWHFPKIRNVSIIRTQRKAVMSLVFMGQHGIIVPKPRHSPEKAIDMCLDWHSSLTGENNTNHVVNIYNNGIVPELPSDSIVEIPAYFKNGVITPKKTIHLDRQIADMVKPHCEEQRLIVNAALGNDIKLIIKAMLNDPMNKWIEDDDRIEYMTKLMLYYEQQWLPEQWREWIPTEKELKESKWYVSPKELAKSGGAYLTKKFPVDEKLKQKAFFWKD